MMRKWKKPDDLVTASELACYAYCPEQWRLRYGLGLEPENRAALDAGTRHHAWKAVAERIALASPPVTASLWRVRKDSGVFVVGEAAVIWDVTLNQSDAGRVGIVATRHKKTGRGIYHVSLQ